MKAKELDLLLKLADKFQRDLAHNAAVILAQIPPHLHAEAKVIMQDRTSLYSPYVAGLIDADLKKRQTRTI